MPYVRTKWEMQSMQPDVSAIPTKCWYAIFSYGIRQPYLQGQRFIDVEQDRGCWHPTGYCLP